MLSCKKICFLLIATIPFASCMEQKIIFDFNKDVNQKFFKEIPGIGDTTFIKFPITKKAVTVEVYVSSFRERFVESDNLLEYTELNDDSKVHAADYWSIIGYSQNLYLVKYKFSYSFKTKNGKLIETPAEGVVFFSVKHNSRGNTTGVTPCYFGIIDEDENLIGFNTPLTLEKSDGKFYLKPHPNKKSRNGILFMPASFPENPTTTNGNLKIEKIVNLDPNKIGGYKPLVFDIGKIFKDSNALSFHYVKNIRLTQ